MADSATMDSIVVAPKWDIDSMIACCSARVVYRLGCEGGYMEKKAYKERLDRALKEGDVWSPPYNDKLEEAQYAEDDDYFGMPIEVAFGAVLNDMRNRCKQGTRHTKDRLFIMTDNMVGHGDVHLGPFSTREFCKWLEDNNYADVQSLETRRLKGWLVCLNGYFTASAAPVRKAKNWWKTQYRYINKMLDKYEAEEQRSDRDRFERMEAYW